MCRTNQARGREAIRSYGVGMSVLQVAGLIESRALIEIAVTALIPAP